MPSEGEGGEEMDTVLVCPAPWERVSLRAEPINLGTSAAGVLAGAMLLAPSRFACCGVDPHASEPVHAPPPLQPPAHHTPYRRLGAYTRGLHKY